MNLCCRFPVILEFDRPSHPPKKKKTKKRKKEIESFEFGISWKKVKDDIMHICGRTTPLNVLRWVHSEHYHSHFALSFSITWDVLKNDFSCEVNFSFTSTFTIWRNGKGVIYWQFSPARKMSHKSIWTSLKAAQMAWVYNYKYIYIYIYIYTYTHTHTYIHTHTHIYKYINYLWIYLIMTWAHRILRFSIQYCLDR